MNFCEELWHVVMSITPSGDRFLVTTRQAGWADVFEELDLDLWDAPLAMVDLDALDQEVRRVRECVVLTCTYFSFQVFELYTIYRVRIHCSRPSKSTLQ